MGWREFEFKCENLAKLQDIGNKFKVKNSNLTNIDVVGSYLKEKNSYTLINTFLIIK